MSFVVLGKGLLPWNPGYFDFHFTPTLQYFQPFIEDQENEQGVVDQILRTIREIKQDNDIMLNI